MVLVNLFKFLLPSHTHDFRKLERGVDYFVDFSESNQLATLTADYKIKVGDIVILSQAEQTLNYRVEAVDFYWNDPDIRTILLKLLTETDH